MTTVRRDVAAIGRVEIAITATQITARTIGGEITLHAPTTNINPIFVGLADVDDATKGVCISPGEYWVMNTLDASKFYGIVAAGTEDLNFQIEIDA